MSERGASGAPPDAHGLPEFEGPPESHRPPETYRPLDISSGLRANARRFPGKIAVTMGAARLSYGALVERMNRVSNAVSALGLGPGQNAAIMAGNSPEYFEIVAGVSATGAAIATVNPRQTPDELGAIAQDCAARIIFTDAAFEDAVRAADLPQGAQVVVIGPAYEAWIARAAATPPETTPPEWATFAIPYTSGTTGRPKGVCLSHRSRVISFFTFASVYGCFGEADRFLVTTPLFHGGGFAFPMAALFLGGAVDLMPHYAPDLLLDAMASGAHSGSFVVPTQFHGMFDLGEAALARLSGHRFRSVVCNAAPLPEDTKLAALTWLGEGVLHETYGSTEAGVVTNLYPAEMRAKQNCAGRPIAGQSVRLLGEDGAEVAPGEVGELFSNGPTLFNGYWNRPEETAASFRDGWFSAGDLARADDEGFLHIVDRKKDMILSGGVNIYPRDIEEVLFAHDAVAEAAVVGIPDPRWGEAVCAFVRAAGPQDPEALIGWCRDRLAPHKVPKSVRFVDAIPRNAAGKVLKKDLRAQVMS
ncbi:MAG: AMP-binding protein [Pseudomonadota bacterium]